MNNSELDRLLKSAPSPQRDAEYWDDFPRTVTAGLRERTGVRDENISSPALGKLYWRWGLGLATACVVAMAGLGFWHGRESRLSARQVEMAQKYYSEVRAMFPNQIKAIVFERQGPRLVLSDKANVPDSPALYLRVCAPNGCQSVVTFSGQQIQVNGETCEVLADADERVMVVGKRRVWAEGLPKDLVRIEGKALGVAM